MSPRVTLGEFTVQIHVTVRVILTELSRRMTQLRWASYHVTAGRITLTGGITFYPRRNQSNRSITELNRTPIVRLILIGFGNRT